jgi:hypothetical protein
VTNLQRKLYLLFVASADPRELSRGLSSEVLPILVVGKELLLVTKKSGVKTGLH